MRIPLDWLAEYVAVPPAAITDADAAGELAAALAGIGLEEEAIHTCGVSGPLVVGQVLSLSPEPQKNGKTINWCTVDVGMHNPAGEAGRGIVCGAHNFAVGDQVVVALAGAVLPGPFPISARKTYGHVSDGMICSERELGLGDDHSGIIVLSRLGLSGEVGQDAISLLGLDIVTNEINVTPDRGYCFSLRGVAREYAYLADADFTDPADRPVPPATGTGFPVQLADAAPIHGVAGCDRFVTRTVSGIDPSAPSPAWMRRRLTQAGMRPISLAVDVTNYVCLEFGQPLHAYDGEALRAPITVRRARAGEHLVTLDDVDRTLDVEDLLITDAGDGEAASRVLGLAGVMGGASTEVSEHTTRVVIEAAHFDAISVARTARRHKLPSEAARRFERGVDPAICAAAADRAVELLVRYGGGQPEADITDLDQRPTRSPIAFDPGEPSRVVGVAYSADQVERLLLALGCTVDCAATPWQVTAPSWRSDLTRPIDLIEDIARLAGYQHIPSVLPAAPGGRGLTFTQRSRRLIADVLAARGGIEVLSYPFVGAETFDAWGYAADDPRRQALRLSNPLAETAPLMRTSVLDSLISVAARNLSRGETDLKLFEIGLVTHPDGVGVAGLPSACGRPTEAELDQIHAAVPAQPRHCAGLASGQRHPAGVLRCPRAVDWADAVEDAVTVGRAVGIELSVRAVEHAPWHPGRAAALSLPGGAIVGYAGELHPQALERLGLPPRTVAFELNLDALLAQADVITEASELLNLPLAKEDLALVVDEGLAAHDLAEAIRIGIGDLAEDVSVFDVYTGEQVPAGKKSVALSVRLRADHTLTSDEVASARQRALTAAEHECGAILRS